jgi:peptide/nickel transport system permease protein
VHGVAGAGFPNTRGVVLVAAFFVVLANIVVDLLYAVLDPRVRRS